MVEVQETSGTRWWGEFHLEEGQFGRWRIGPLDLWVQRTALDWRYGAARGEDGLLSALDIQVPAALAGVEEDLPEEQGRFGFTATGSRIELVPALADRPVVARPAVPFFVPPGQRVDLYVSTPLWVRLRAGGAELAEVPCMRPSDTWFGSNTAGVLGYATRIHLRRRVDDLPLRAHRAVSCLTVENDAKEILTLERLSLPVPQLSLFASPSGTLWTEHVRVKRAEGEELAEVELGKGPPPMAGGGQIVAPPRASRGGTFASLVFGGLFDNRY